MADTRLRKVTVNDIDLYLPQIKVFGLWWRTFNREDPALYAVYRRNDEAQWSDSFEGPFLQGREDIFYHKNLANDVITEYREQLDKGKKEDRIRKVLSSKYFR